MSFWIPASPIEKHDDVENFLGFAFGRACLHSVWRNGTSNKYGLCPINRSTFRVIQKRNYQRRRRNLRMYLLVGFYDESTGRHFFAQGLPWNRAAASVAAIPPATQKKGCDKMFVIGGSEYVVTGSLLDQRSSILVWWVARWDPEARFFLQNGDEITSDDDEKEFKSNKKVHFSKVKDLMKPSETVFQW